MHELELVNDNESLVNVAAAIHRANEIAIDTEFVRERTYFPQLCVIQIATNELMTGIDCLANLDLGSVIDALYRPDCTWVLHSARQDLEVMWNLSRRQPSSLIDTQIAGALLGHPPQQSLQDMLAEVLGVAISKTHTRTDWSRRPLPAAALAYAIDDVRHLLAAWRVLKDRLVEKRRIDWVFEDCRRLLTASPVTTAATVYERLRGTGRLSTEERSALYALVEWREEEAQALNRPRRWVLSDEQLSRIARAMPMNKRELDSIEDMPRKLISRSGSRIIEALRGAAMIVSPDDSSSDNNGRPDKARLKALKLEVDARARELGIASEVLATRRDLSAMALGATPEYLQQGWRAEVLRELA